MIKVKIYGGLGNQMFQYAMGRALALRNNAELCLDISWFDSNHSGNMGRRLGINNLNIEARLLGGGFGNLASKVFIVLGMIKVIKEKTLFNFDQSILKIKDGRLDGFWQNENYFKDYEDQITQDFTLRKPLSNNAQEILNKINNSTSVAIHIRRGDYVNNQETNKFHGICSVEYYHKAISLINSKIADPYFFIFSDDIEWVKENLKIKDPVNWVSGNQLSEVEELILLSKCQHQIIANSSFSWWGAWLNKNVNKVVIGPKNWINSDVYDTSGLLPESWLKL